MKVEPIRNQDVELEENKTYILVPDQIKLHVVSIAYKITEVAVYQSVH